MNLEELIKDLDEELVITETKRIDKTIYITCTKETKQSTCPYCGEASNKIHSKYIRTLCDLPIQNNEVKLLLVTRKFFCTNPKCNHKTFGERFDFVEDQSVKTNRLIKHINQIGLRDSSLGAVKTLKETGINVSSNTILRIIKKNKN